MNISTDSKTTNCENMQHLAQVMKASPFTYKDINDNDGKLESEFIKIESTKKSQENSEVLILSSKEYLEYFKKLEKVKPFTMSLDATFAVVPRLKGVYQMLTIMIKHEYQVYKKSIIKYILLNFTLNIF